MYKILVFSFIITLAGCSFSNNLSPIQNNSHTDTAQLKQDVITNDITVSGTAQQTKGGQIMVGDVLVNNEQITEAHFTVDELVGKKVEIYGNVLTHYCYTFEQCTMSDSGELYLKSFKDIEYIKIIN